MEQTPTTKSTSFGRNKEELHHAEEEQAFDQNRPRQGSKMQAKRKTLKGGKQDRT